MFNVDFDKLVNWLTPVSLRKPVFLAWLAMVCSPVVQLYNEFITARNKDIYNLAHDGRVFSLQAVLNDRFDNTDRRIYITDGPNKNRVYLYQTTANKPLYLGSKYLFTPAGYTDTGIDFIVFVPAAITITIQDLTEMDILVNTYKLAGKRFKIYRI